jgi:hypothetical protein
MLSLHERHPPRRDNTQRQENGTEDMLVKTVRRGILLSVWTIVISGLVSCASGGAGPAGPGDQWLSGKGFAGRAGWSSTALHLRKQQMRSILRVSQLIRRVPEVRLQPSRANPLGLTRILDGDPGSCALQVYLNGVRMVPRDSLARVDLDARVGVPDLDALELHLGPDGPVYDPEGCGSLLLWNRSMRHVQDPEFSGSIRGQVQSQSPDRVAGVRIGSSGPLQRPDSAGVFSFLGLLPGEYQLEVIVAEGSVGRQSVRVFAFTESQVTLQGRRR